MFFFFVVFLVFFNKTKSNNTSKLTTLLFCFAFLATRVLHVQFLIFSSRNELNSINFIADTMRKHTEAVR